MENQVLQGVQAKCKSAQSSFKSGAPHLPPASTVSPALGTSNEQLCQRCAHTNSVCRAPNPLGLPRKLTTGLWN